MNENGTKNNILYDFNYLQNIAIQCMAYTQSLYRVTQNRNNI